MASTASDADTILIHPADIRAALFELTHPDCHILVRDPADRHTAVLMLGVDKQTEHFFWRPRDHAGADFEHKGAGKLHAGMVLHFQARGYGGVQMHFRVPRPELVPFDDGSAALVSPFPERMSRIQRRKLFRALVSGPALRCSGHWRPASAAQPLPFTLFDVSVEGVGLRIQAAVADLPQPGATLRDVYLDFGEFGNMTASLAVRTLIPLSGQPMDDQAAPPTPEGQAQRDDAAGAPVSAPAPPTAGAPKEPPLSHIGAAFVGLDGRATNWLQQVVWRLEKARALRI